MLVSFYRETPELRGIAEEKDGPPLGATTQQMTRSHFILPARTFGPVQGWFMRIRGGGVGGAGSHLIAVKALIASQRKPIPLSADWFMHSKVLLTSPACGRQWSVMQITFGGSFVMAL